MYISENTLHSNKKYAVINIIDTCCDISVNIKTNYQHNKVKGPISITKILLKCLTENMKTRTGRYNCTCSRCV